MVRVMDGAIGGMDMRVLFARYPGDGSSAYHPVMILKTLVYHYASGIYSSRKIAKATRENINFMWLTSAWLMVRLHVLFSAKQSYRVCAP